MGFRTIIIKKRCKLDYSLNYLVYRADVERRIHISEISMLIIESNCTSITSTLIMNLVKNKVKIIFCDDQHLPSSQIMSFEDNYHSSKCISEQTKWTSESKGLIWKNIVYNKIKSQYYLMIKNNCNSVNLLQEYMCDVKDNDITNREGHSAKVYFNEVFALDGRRNSSFINSALNYGYSILLSAFCRAITSCGYITQIGIWHCNEFNPYNLASDFMETYRVIVDELVLSITSENEEYFKSIMANVMNAKVKISNKWYYLEDGIMIYVQSLFKALNNNDVNSIKNYVEYELPIYENNSYV